MQLLVPPLEDTGLGDFGPETGDVSTSNSRGRSVMSQGLQDKFEAMEQTFNQARTSAQRSESAAASTESGAAATEQDVSREDERQKKKRKVAMETAFAIESEVQKWQRGIAELEAMLEEAGADVGDSQRSSSSSLDGDDAPPEVVRFPSLPPIVPAEEGDLEGSTTTAAGSGGMEDETDDH